MAFQNLKKLDLNLLLVLDALIEEQHVSKAAARIGMTQSAVSHALNRLRHHFGDPLFIREKREMLPTTFTSSLKPDLKNILHRIDSLSTQKPDFDPATANTTFTIGMPDYIAIAILADLTAMIAHESPFTKIITLNVNAQTGVQALEDGLADLIIGRFDDPPKTLKVEKLFTEDYVCVLRKTHPLAKSKKLTLKDYVAADHMHISLAGKNRGLVDDYLAKTGHARNVTMTLSNYMLGLSMAETGNLILTEPRRTVAPWAKKLNVTVMDFPKGGLSFPVCQLWHRRHDTDTGHKWLRGRIEKLAKKLEN